MGLPKYVFTDKWEHRIDPDGKPIFLDADGDDITNERILRHIETIKMEVLKCWPKAECKQTAQKFDDLVQDGIVIAYRSLCSFSSTKAIDTINVDGKYNKKDDAKHMAEKKSNPAEAIIKIEKMWIRNACGNHFRYVRDLNSLKKLGGLEVPMDLESIHTRYFKTENGENLPSVFSDGSECESDSAVSHFKNGLSYDHGYTCLNPTQAEADYRMLTEVASKGQDAVMKLYNKMSKERQEDFREFMAHTPDGLKGSVSLQTTEAYRKEVMELENSSSEEDTSSEYEVESNDEEIED